jgi:hypothetical protein
MLRWSLVPGVYSAARDYTFYFRFYDKSSVLFRAALDTDISETLFLSR